jgi:hypothetical protein
MTLCDGTKGASLLWRLGSAHYTVCWLCPTSSPYRTLIQGSEIQRPHHDESRNGHDLRPSKFEARTWGIFPLVECLRARHGSTPAMIVQATVDQARHTQASPHWAHLSSFLGPIFRGQMCTLGCLSRPNLHAQQRIASIRAYTLDLITTVNRGNEQRDKYPKPCLEPRAAVGRGACLGSEA